MRGEKPVKNKINKIGFASLISAVFIIFIGLLGVLSVFMHCDTNIYDYDHAKTIVGHRAYLYVPMAIAGIGIILFWCALFERRFSQKTQERVSRIIPFVCGGITLLAGICWICFNDCAPIYDQRTVYQEAQRIAGFVDEPYNIEYFSLFHRNRGIVLLVSAALKVFGNHLYAFRLLNLAAVVIIYFSIYRTAGMIFKNPLVSSITAVLLMVFYPLIVYTSFIYGTLLSAAFTSFGLYAVAALCETGKHRYAVYIILAFPFGVLMHQSAAIGLVAAVIYLVMNGKRENLLRNFLIFILSVIMVFGFLKAADTAYDRITGAAPSTAVPVICTIYMGLTSTAESGGPGSQDGSYVEIFIENHYDAAAANRDALRRIGKVVQEYLSGERSLAFFLEKTEYQWLDPSFGARKIICLNDPAAGDALNAEAFLSFYHSTLRWAIFKIFIAFMLLIYIGAFMSGLQSIRSAKLHPAAILLQLYVIGGCAFQMLWESLSRYCFAYFLWLIPLAAYGFYLLYRRVESIQKKRI